MPLSTRAAKRCRGTGTCRGETCLAHPPLHSFELCGASHRLARTAGVPLQSNHRAAPTRFVQKNGVVMPTIAMVGDIFLQEALPQRAELAAIAEVLRRADIAFGNLETPVSERGTPIDKWINMRMPPALLADVADMGFDIVTLANNHMWDFGEVAFNDTLGHLRARQLPFVGAGGDLDAAWRPAILPLGELNIAFLGATSTLGPGSAAAEGRPGVAPIQVSESYHLDPPASLEQPGSAPYVFTRAWREDLERAISAIKEARSQADFVVLALHWGVPPFWRPRFQDGLADYQIEVGHALIDAGADVIVGHHPHSLQEVEVYRGKPIFYSLGNFVFHHNLGSGRVIRRSAATRRIRLQCRPAQP